MGLSHFCGRAINAIILLALVLSCKNNQNTSSQKDSKPSGAVEVKGSAKDEGPVDYTQDSDSVSIGGTNLTSSLTSSYSISALLIESTGTKEIYSGVSDSSEFSFKIIASSYVRVDVTTGGKTLSAIIPPSFEKSGTTTAYVTLDRTTNIAAKLMTIIADKAAAGDSDAKTALDQWSIPVQDLYIAASSARRAVDNDATVSAAAPSVNLSDLASKMVASCNQKVKDLASEMTYSQYAVKVSESAQKVTFGSDALNYSPRVLAYRTATDLGTSSAANYDVAYSAIKAMNNVFVIGAYQTEGNAYRAADSVSAAATSESTVTTSYTAVFTKCQTDPTTCVDTTAAVAAPSACLAIGGGSTTTGTTTGSTTGSTTGGTTACP